MGFERNGVYLLKRWSAEKGVDHYAVGLAGSAARWMRCWTPVVVQLVPGRIDVAPWSKADSWEALALAQDEIAALRRLERARGMHYAPVDSNCEHFAREVVTGVRESRQVQAAVALGLLVAALVFSR